MPQRWRNYEIVQALWQSIDWDNVPPSGKSTRAEHIPTWHDMRQAWTTYWTEDHPMTYIQYSQAINCAWWGYFIGPRSKEDIRRLKISRDIVRRPREGQTSVGFVGGRCKTPVKTAWRGYGVCMCPDGVHIVPEPSDLDNLDEKGNPIEIRDPLADVYRKISLESSMLQKETPSVTSINAYVSQILSIKEIFGVDLPDNPHFRNAVTREFEKLMNQGALKSVQDLS